MRKASLARASGPAALCSFQDSAVLSFSDASLMGKRWGAAGGGGRRPTLDLGGAALGLPMPVLVRDDGSESEDAWREVQRGAEERYIGGGIF